jgi:hypothetical protein
MAMQQATTSTNSADLTGASHRAEDTHRASRPRSPKGLGFARAACVVGLLFAAVSAYWGLGGTWLLDTLRHSLEDGARAGNTDIYVAAWAAVVLKIMAAVLPLLALRPLGNPAWNRRVWALAWTAAAILISYGLAQTILGLLAIHGSASADDRVWSAYLWDPWLLTFGLLVAAALVRGRHHRSPPPIG